MSVERRLKELIELSGLNLNQIAKESSIDYATLYRFLNEGRKVQITVIEKLCSFFGLGLCFNEEQLKKVVKSIAKEAIDRNGRQFKHSNGKIRIEDLKSFLTEGDLPKFTDDNLERMVVDQFNQLPIKKKTELLDEVISEIQFAKCWDEANLQMLQKIDQDLPEFRDSYEHLDVEDRSTLLAALSNLVEIHDKIRRLGCPHKIDVCVKVSHCYHDNEGEVLDSNSVELNPRIMLKAAEEWQKGEEFTPKSIMGLL